MAYLIVEDGTASPQATVGGAPLASPKTEWPICRSCSGPMQFLAQVPLGDAGLSSNAFRDKILLMFQCQNDPGMCDEWVSKGGGNAALLVSSLDREPLPVPSGPTLLPHESRIKLVSYDDRAAQETPDDNYCKSVDENQLALGKLGGRPLWMQGDETPQCECGAKMTFAVQLEARGGGGINFGDAGTGYAFVCDSCAQSAKFLWQCA